jgi:hypothetical protein
VQADIPDAEVIHGRYKNDGSLRVIDTSQGSTCRTSEQRVATSQSVRARRIRRTRW